jgi:tetratricopeptide (TPR) repeat protein
MLKDDKEATPALNKCIDDGAVNQLGSANALIMSATFLANSGDYQRAIIVVEKLSQVYGDSAEVWFNLAKLYAITGNVEKAKENADKAIKIDPTFKGQVDELFKK